MKTKKLSLFKCIFIYFCCTLLFSSSIFVSYNTTVYASEAEWDDAARAGIWIAATIAGLFFVPEITAPIVIGALAETGVNAVTIGKYIYENSDGTYTISPEFVQAVMDAAKQLEEQGFSDSHVTAQGKGNLYIYKWTVTNTFTQNFDGKVYPGRRHIYNRSCELATRVAGFNEIVINNSSTDYYHNVYQYKNGGINPVLGSGTYSFNNFQDERVVSNLLSSTSDSLSLDGVNRYDGSSSFGGNFPIFSTRDAMNEYLRTGKGYKDAENYRPTPIFRRHSSYTPTYSGGSITVNRTVIENISEKIAEVDARELLSDDEKIELLQQYILTGKLDGGTGGGNTDYEDNKDVPAGTDLADTNSWLKKIYLKVCQIFDKISETAGQTTDDVVNSINDLGTMLKKYLSEITNDLDDIKGSLENMSEQEFSDKSDSFLGEATESFSDISEVAKTKFPLSIPNDLKNIIAVFTQKPPEPEVKVYNLKTTLYGMSARDSDIIMITEGNETYSSGWSETGAPVFNLPIVVESVGLNYAIVVDLSDFQSVAKLCRTYMTLVYIWALLMLTIKVIGLWGELVD